MALTSSSCSSCSWCTCSLSVALSLRISKSATRCCSAASFSVTVFSVRSWSTAVLCSNSRCFIFCLNTFKAHTMYASQYSQRLSAQIVTFPAGLVYHSDQVSQAIIIVSRGIASAVSGCLVWILNSWSRSNKQKTITAKTTFQVWLQYTPNIMQYCFTTSANPAHRTFSIICHKS